MVRVAVVEDQPLYRDMIVTLLRAQEGVEVVLIADGASSARAEFQPGTIDVAVLDVHLSDGNGLALGVSLCRKDPNLGVLLLSSHDVMELLLDLPEDVRAGWSYLSKNSTTSVDVLMRAIQSTARGITVIDPALAEGAFPRAGSSLSVLSDRQYEVLRHVAAGLTNEGIGEKLGISSRSVENHINAIYASLGLPRGRNQRVSAVLRFIEETSRHDF
ncbi:response regulator transcription factor [Gryllotalpicola sp.]|uniref:response regulator transcription factor n=1 Tax=Gryllotalpicola sp. TaxID=1932787 RepID=UPI00262416CA|nr:response regulator transcription factor [Gryllotalpicola sp.]